MSDQVSPNEILEAINASSSAVQEQLDSISGRVDSISGRVDLISGRVDSIEKRMATKEDLRVLEQKIIDHVDDRVADLEGTLVTRERKADQKVNLIIDILERHQVGTSDEIARVRQVKLFPTAPERV